ncbi:hypothetical protein D6D19_01156 [Aureobasidium pullulans]|uniref:MICOS complex subunit MIC10 n=1 Tax=Aureobasidium pullulans TaxID=5580 RepID=A0A4S9AIL5_AURPU|nr:hypothetical protein D6D19_01156 [Aureobasidium pullulans]
MEGPSSASAAGKRERLPELAGQARASSRRRQASLFPLDQFSNPHIAMSDSWDHCLSTMLIRSTLGASFGVIFSVLLFKRRAWPAFVGFGFGAGRAWEECDNSFKRAAAPTRDGLRTMRQ